MRYLISLWILIAIPVSSLASELAPFAAFDAASESVLNDPHDLAIGPDGHLYVADKFAGSIAILDPDTLEIVGQAETGYLPNVHDISFSPDGTTVIAVTGSGAVLVYLGFSDKSGEPVRILAASRTEGALAHSNGTIYAMAGGTGTLIAYKGDQAVAFAEGHVGAHDVAEAPDGGIWVADNFNRRLVKYSPDLQQQMIIDDPKFGFVGPRYLDVDSFGRLIVADQDAHRILLIDPDGPDGGTLLGVLGDGSPGMGPNKFDDPEGVHVEGNRFYFSDSDNNRIVRYSIVTN
ncbi:MAG: NHL repeat-containing protein [Rhizobiaceae bacterium]